ncbi:hypothetical protein [Candidatus Mycobacterium methanotrophicum]|uniref:hypothetical protein n=1 Tax=Candidatus Mycobacterium methanotrophicum TaxID=2943498 RepID=UPI001C5757DF|nr:hypothetical protein [Candidatus Mycobacterium methanotrophicum]
MDYRQEEKRRDRGSADLNENKWNQMPNGVHDVADETHYGGPDQEAPEEPDGTSVIPLGDLGLGSHRVSLPGVRP